ncbi:hypothetical protein A3C60_00380 [Candidatus Nomurabacteria bacterium RIFCSPHIGHO2_02_FULL_37_45]|uniref:Uncharacterized protein n=1 Tax=Candidatus Nomurabacteria bacterium RIFCSPHIGHO2_12_FULL_37_29 TaxID=1801759 RepID=A0A1F6WBH9_9BACT|nr:MAG: hypothetical protein A2727_00395 [Candidatus Nomurabacteria bacterium RIFCSPHIGHO2_01_FULL_37_110]OGI70953.1 MAG: hypothetical protein A3C60_00380 [Candidatus Nomurabacteria bacterium RIFCSPHIGHO2_02_FULL_37_45]OGI79241.1 MAG: hypothetical protein A3F19_01180 [Candidatus Nomurabacteria bacterium RIFCSPHIGHO2_12_FULL_37_29]OGI85363.1 MAG: hypothetical protein A3A92_01495 [Candidatus Nomurabacteria bacterium RIFCSPLOWO2_01_FULL_37_49]
MQDKLKEVFSKGRYLPEKELTENIWRVIVLHDKRNLHLKFWTFSFIGLISLVGLVPAFKILSNNLVQSGFYEYLSLAFTSDGSILNYWRDFLLLLGESLPVMSITLLLSLIFIFFLSLKYAMKQTIKSQLVLSF